MVRVLQAVDLDSEDVADGPWPCPEYAQPPLAAGRIVLYEETWGSGLIDADDGGAPVALDGGDAIGHPAFLQGGCRVVFRREHTPRGPRAREARSSPHGRMEP